jgi:phospholipase C
MAVRVRGLGLALLALIAPASTALAETTTPIEHLIVVVGENLSFDNLFGTYRPRSDAAIRNLLSQGIVNRTASRERNSQKPLKLAPGCATPTK